MARPKTHLEIDEFLRLVSARRGAQIVSLSTRTQLRLLRHHRVTGERVDDRYPLGVIREAVGRSLLNYHYQNNVNAQRTREDQEPDFVASPLWVSARHPEGAGQPDRRWPQYLVVHVDTRKKYLRVRPKTNNQGRIVKEHDRYVDVATGCAIVGDELADLLENCLPEKRPSRKQHLDHEIQPRTYELPGLMAVCHGGRWYILKHAKAKSWA